MSNPKSNSRLAVVQALYSLNIDSFDSFENREDILSHTIAEIKADGSKVKNNFCKQIFNFALDEEESIKFIIEKYLDKTKKVEELNPLLYSCLRGAFAELLYDKETSRAIIISEYIKITEDFFSKTEAGFVNAVLDRFVKAQ
ncbi:MAG: transcription antitermination protein NusB [Rickettsiales bacterium]|nr:transcription antitermination protein NusB [Rickettsiales bacterium]